MTWEENVEDREGEMYFRILTYDEIERKENALFSLLRFLCCAHAVVWKQTTGLGSKDARRTNTPLDCGDRQSNFSGTVRGETQLVGHFNPSPKLARGKSTWISGREQQGDVVASGSIDARLQEGEVQKCREMHFKKSIEIVLKIGKSCCRSSSKTSSKKSQPIEAWVEKGPCAFLGATCGPGLFGC